MVKEQIILSAITQHVWDNKAQSAWVYERSCLTNLIFCDKVTGLVDKGKVVDVVYLSFSKAFASFSAAFSCRNLLLVAWTGVPFAG